MGNRKSNTRESQRESQGNTKMIAIHQAQRSTSPFWSPSEIQTGISEWEKKKNSEKRFKQQMGLENLISNKNM